MNFDYKDVLLNDIFAKNDPDSTTVIVDGFDDNGTTLIYKQPNGSVSKQNSIDYENFNNSVVDSLINLSAYYTDYKYTGNVQTISVNDKCKEIRVLLCGAGGSGGSGAGDTTGQRGESGTGGGGGAYYYKSIPITQATVFELTIGKGGDPVTGSGGGNSGKNGIAGGITRITKKISDTLSSVEAQASGGSGGLGGHPDDYRVGGAGGTTGSGTSILGGDNGSGSTPDRSQLLISPGGKSGWVKLKSGNTTYPKYSLLYPNDFFGNGGAGSRGEYNPQTLNSGPGQHGWARVYFLY